MPPFTTRQAEVAAAIIRHGLGMTPTMLSRREVIGVLEAVQRLAREGHTAEDIILAAQHGMRATWPFTDGRAWTAQELERNITKAKAEAVKIRRRDRIPRQAAEVRRPHGRPEA